MGTILNSRYLKSKYDQEIPQPHTADQPTAPKGRATEHKQSEDKLTHCDET